MTRAGFEEPRRQARRLIAASLDLSAAEVFAHPERSLDPAQRQRAAMMLARLLRREPLSRITGRREFWGLEFRLSADTLDPRPDSETLVGAVLARLPDRQRPYRFLDLGTGSGCLLLTLLSEFSRAQGIGVDIAFGAAATARDNAARLGLGGRAWFVTGNWGAALGQPFDAVVANPPYIAHSDIPDLPPEVRNYDPLRALDGGMDGLAAYREIAADLPRLLTPGGLFVAEIGACQGAAAAALFNKGKIAVEAVLPDLAGLPRCLVAWRSALG